MKAALIAAGLGERLQAAGISLPKPLVPIGGVPLIDRVLRSVAAAGIREVACIFNEQADAVEEHCRRSDFGARLTIVRKSTPSSMESLFTLAPRLDDRFLLLTVDAVFGPRVLPDFLTAADRHRNANGVLAVTSFVDDEKPLYVRFDEGERITAIGPTAAGSDWITAGFYVFDPVIFREIDAARAARFTALRQFLGYLLERGYPMAGVGVGQSVDVDRPEDIAVAEEFLRESVARKTAGAEEAHPLPLPPLSRRLNTLTSSPLSQGGRAGKRYFLGIARERVYSPGKVEDDRAILEEVAERLRVRHEVKVVSADEPLPEPDGDTVVFTMAQGPQALEAMYRWQGRGVRIFNSPQAIENCHRRRTIAAFERHAVAHPRSALVDTAAPRFPNWIDNGPIWLKRGDVHATDPGDVVRADSARDAARVCSELARRGIGSALVQAHVEGTVIKFYAVPGRFFECYPRVDDKTARERLVALAEMGAAALELDVFGGDCVLAPDGSIHLIDLNDWPSYGRCRLRAAAAIAAHLEQRSSEEERG